MDSNEYHGIDALSASRLSVFLRSRRLYEGRFVTGTIPQPAPSDAMRIGTLVHTLVLEPQTFGDRYAISPKVDRRTTEGKKKWATFVEYAEGKEALDVAEYDKASLMASAVLRHIDAGALLSIDGPIEKSIQWVDVQTGQACKARPDKLVGNVVLDLKTTSDPRPAAFAKSVWNYGYYRQAAFYLAASQQTETPCERFAFICVQSEQPWSVAMYELDREALEVGRAECRKGLDDLSLCFEHDDWEDEWERGVNTLSLPRWAKYEDEYQLESDATP